MKNKNKIILSIIILIIILLTFVSITYKPDVNTILINEKLQPIRNGTNKDYIAFTCNVDWGNEYIPPMLEIFEKSNIKITFFVSGRWAKNNPDLLKEIYSKGHEIGNHGYGHRMHSKISYEENYEEINNTHSIVKEILGLDMKLFAPPAGDFGEITLEVANQLKYNTILWNIDTIDWRKDSTSDKIVNRVLNKPLEGSIVLMHPKEETIKALPEIIKGIREKNINIGKVSDVLD